MQQDSIVNDTHQFNPSDYPQSYLISGGWKITLSVLTVLLGFLSFFVFGYFGIINPPNSLAGLLFLIACCFGLFLLCVYLAFSIVRTKVILTPDSIELYDVLTVRSMERAKIKSWRMYIVNGIKVVDIFPIDSSTKKIKLSVVFTPDQTFSDWFSNFPNSDQIVLQEHQNEISNDLRLGENVEERLKNATRAKKIAKAVNWLVIGLCAWVYMYPSPYDILIISLLLIPWLIIGTVWVTKGLYVLTDQKNSLRGSLLLPFILPCLVLVLRAIRDVGLVDWHQLIVPSMVLAGVMMLILFRLVKQSWGEIVFIGVICLVYMGSAITLSDAMLDHGKDTVFPVQVLGKHFTSGKATMYYLSLSPWNNQITDNNFTVPMNLYQTTNVGAMVCVHRFDGAYHMPWFVITHC